MDEAILNMLDKTTLKGIAVDKGLSSAGYNNRNMSRMRKQDFIDFILYKDRVLASPSSNNQARSLQQRSSEESSFEEDDLFDLFRELLTFGDSQTFSRSIDDSFQPIIHIMGGVTGRRIRLFNRSNNSLSNIEERESNVEERVPKEEDESVPCLSLKEIIKQDKLCAVDCDCEICKKNRDIVEKNLKTKNNIQELENKITCVVCLDNLRNIMFSPCNHLATCISCSKNFLLGKKCPICRKEFNSIIRVFC